MTLMRLSFKSHIGELPGRDAARPQQARRRAPSATVATGWISATGVSQHIHQNVPRSGGAISAGLPRGAEWKRDRASPLSALATGVPPLGGLR